MSEDNKTEIYPTLQDHINQDVLSANIDAFVKQTHNNAIENIGTGKIKLPFDDMLNTEDNELDVKNNFACFICKNMAIAPVMQCDECEMIFCS